MLYIGYTQEQMTKIIGYMETKPYAEVHEVMDILLNQYLGINVDVPAPITDESSMNVNNDVGLDRLMGT